GLATSRLLDTPVKFEMELTQPGTSPGDNGAKVVSADFAESIGDEIVNSPEVKKSGARAKPGSVKRKTHVLSQSVNPMSYMAFDYVFANADGTCTKPELQALIPGSARSLPLCRAAAQSLGGRFLRVEQDTLYPQGCYQYMPLVQVGAGKLFFYLNLAPKIESDGDNPATTADIGVSSRPERARMICQQARPLAKVDISKEKPLPYFDPCKIVYPMGKDSGATVLGLDDRCRKRD
ncbi:unnamed protein product, partial [Amoebophrya sp. A25]